jgi:putative tricarboxylic transport membrane protein
VAVFGLAAVSFLIGGSPVKGLLSALIGVAASLVGTDIITGADRFTFGQLELLDGINVVVMLVGLYALPPVLGLLERARETGSADTRIAMGSLLRQIPEMLKFRFIWLRSALIGIGVGILPGAGGSMAAFLSYNETVRAARDRSRFGKGEPAGVAAAECGNNSDNAAALIPALTLGIPGSSVTAVILGALLVHGLQPGPELFRNHPDIVYGFMLQMFFSSLLLVFLGGPIATKTFARLLGVPRPLLAPIILSMMVIGVYSIQGSMFDVFLMFGFGALGYFMERLGMPLAPAVLGLILGEYAERNFRLGMMIGLDDPSIFWTRPISQALIVLTAVVLVWPLIRNHLAARRARRSGGH